MMASLLSVFDPCTNLIIPNWLSLLIIILFPLSSKYWKFFSMIQISFQSLMTAITLLFKSKSKTDLVFVSFFFFILLVNLTGLIPYSFSLSSHFSFNFSLGLTIWLSIIIWGFSMNFSSNVAHYTPMGCPTILIPFMVLVEMISAIIRPITLSLRLMSNMLAGHMILSLMSSGICFLSKYVKPIFLMMDMFFLCFELGVAFIQAYVFTMLISMYWEEAK